MLKFSGLVIWRLGSRNSVRKYSAPGVTMFKADKTDSPANIPGKNPQTPALTGKETSSK